MSIQQALKMTLRQCHVNDMKATLGGKNDELRQLRAMAGGSAALARMQGSAPIRPGREARTFQMPRVPSQMKNGARGRNRTTDTRIFNPLLYP